MENNIPRWGLISKSQVRGAEEESFGEAQADPLIAVEDSDEHSGGEKVCTCRDQHLAQTREEGHYGQVDS